MDHWTGYFKFQVFLHTAKELPQVRDLGFAIAPGTHALVGVRLNEVGYDLSSNWFLVSIKFSLTILGLLINSGCQQR